MSERRTNQVARTGSPALIVIGGFAGTGKTALSRRLSRELRLPRLDADTIGRTIRASEGMPGAGSDAGGASELTDQVKTQWIAYDVLFALTAEFLQSGVTTILDLTMGWEFQWQRIEALLQRCPQTTFLPLLLRCPRPICLSRILQRYTGEPGRYDAPEMYVTDPRMLDLWDYLEQLDRPDVHWIDASRSLDEVYALVKATLLAQAKARPRG